MTPLLTPLAALALIATGCAAYDAPPESALSIPDGGKWFGDTPLQLRFTEKIDPGSLVLTIWPRDLDDEGNLNDGVVPVASDCTVAGSPCGDIAITFNDEGDVATVAHGAALGGLHGKQLIVEVHAGLKDTAGRERKVKDWYDFSITPECLLGQPIDIELTSGVWALFADLTAVVPGIYLQMYVDVSIDSTNGELWMSGTVATNEGDPGTTDPTNLVVYDDDKGWAVFMTGQIGTKPDGRYCVSTDPSNLKVKVLGLIDVQMDDFKLEFGVSPKALDGRDQLEGFMTSSKVFMGEADLGAAAAPVLAYGTLPAEIPPTMPRLCQADPCAIMKTEGGDCQLADPWTPGPGTACE